jgi:hypothetical protein
VDPREYEVLYFGTDPLVCIQETLLLTADPIQSRWLFNRTRAEAASITSYKTAAPLLAATLDEPNDRLLGLEKVSFLLGKQPYRRAALRIRRERRDIPALCWRSKHREASGYVIAIFDDKKIELGLERIGSLKLLDHPVIADLEKYPRLVIL